jgi:S1-C subfamily serine protease
MRSHRVVVTAVALAFLLMGGLFSAQGFSPAAAQGASTPAAGTSEYPAVNVVQQVGPAVVTVINEQTVQGGGLGVAAQPQAVGSGTGFIIDDQGHIVTNWHVVYQGQQFQVVFANGESREAKLIGSDSVSDLAVVQVSGNVPGTVSFGDSDQLRPGEPVLAIGSPLGSFENTVTEGIVGATNRDFPIDPSQGGSQNYTNLIQHDAPINPGNSGGPLLNLDGQVVGVNTLGIPSENGQPVQGLFFAIPSNTVQQITQQLIENGQVAYPYLGITPIPIDPTIAAQNQLDVNYGAYVYDVSRNGPAAKAGIQAGDIITAINGQQIDQTNSFTEVLYAHKPGETVQVTIDRGGQTQSVDVTLGERPQTT